MKKIVLFFFAALLSGTPLLLSAQCYGVVTFDVATSANGSNTFTITTSRCNELIMISYDGWMGPGNGPVTVDGNPATYINTAFVYYYAVAETYAYNAATAGIHTIVCTEPPYGAPYFLNSAAAFYVTGSGSPINIGSLTSAQATVSCVGGGSVTTSIATTIPGSMIYDNFDNNNGQNGPFIDSWIGGTFMNKLHEGNGIDQSEAYTIAPTAGTYTVSANSSANPGPCGGLALLLVAIPPPLCSVGGGGLHATVTLTNPTCGNCNGSVNITVGAGNPPYAYKWSPYVSTTNVATGLCGGSDTCRISDASCPQLDTTIIVTLLANKMTTSANVTANENCNGDCIGSAIAIVIGGTTPYTYNWLPSGGTAATATGMCAGIYTVTVQDSNGCSGTAIVNITQPLPLTSTETINDILCNGGNASATVTAAGGVSPYMYAWNPSGQTNATATGLLVGTYTVTINDINGCTETTTVVISQPTQITASMGAPTYPLCNGFSGSATVTPGGGTPNYSYLWAPVGGNSATGTGLTAGGYTVTVQDANGCTATASVTITQPLALATTTSFTHASCGLANGSATVKVIGGVAPYIYSWSPGGQTTATATKLLIGTYTVTVTDNNNCTTSAAVTVTQPSAVTAVITATKNVSCNNGGNGAITLTAGGGTVPYTYLWTPSGNTNASPNDFFALTYTVTVTDANGCTVSTSATLTQPPVLDVSISEPVLICKDSTGNIYGNSTGGTAPYKYAWSGGVTSTTGTATITPIATRDYSVVVTDNNGCTASAAIVLKYGPNLLVEVKGKNSVCKGDSTTLCAYASGGEGTATYLWQPSNNTDNCINVIPGIASAYTVQVVDGCGATTTASTTVYTSPSPVIGLSADIYEGCAPLCIQFRNTTSISQGGIRQYVWTFGNKDTSQAINPIYCYPAGGLYSISLTAMSDSGCTATFTKGNLIMVYKRPDASFTYSPQPVTILTPTIQFTDESTDKSGIAYRIWSFGDGSDSVSTLANPSHTYHDTGNYCANLVVMNGHGCTDTVTNCFVIGPQYTLYIPSAFTPNGDGLNDIFQPKGQYVKGFEMYIFDRWGLQVYHSTDIHNGWNGAVRGVGSICQNDTYIYKIKVTDTQDNEHTYIGDISLSR